MYTAKLRENKLRQLESIESKPEKFIYQHKKQSEDAVLMSCLLSEMIAKSSRSFIEEAFIKDCILKVANILCPAKKKLLEDISLASNTVASRVDKLAANTYKQLTSAAKEFYKYSIASIQN